MSKEELERLDDKGIAPWNDHGADAFVALLSDDFLLCACLPYIKLEMTISKEELGRLGDKGIAPWNDHGPDVFVELLSDDFVLYACLPYGKLDREGITGARFWYVGREVYSPDGEKLGEVRKVVQGDYMVIDRAMARDIVVPLSVLEQSSDRLVLPYTEQFLDDAPEVNIDLDLGLSVEDRRELDYYYLHRAA